MGSLLLHNKISPDSLFDQCIYYLSIHSRCFDLINQVQIIPYKIWDTLLDSMQRNGIVLDDMLMKVIQNHSAKLSKIYLWNCEFKEEESLFILSKQNLIELDLANCKPDAFNTNNFFLLQYLNGLDSLEVFSCGEYMTNTIFAPAFKKEDESFSFETWDYILKAPNLKQLAIKNLNCDCPENFLLTLVTPLTKLNTLDLSGCKFSMNLSSLSQLRHLNSLILHNTNLGDEGLKSIMCLGQLRHLDLSFVGDKFKDPNLFLESLMKNLQNLNSLDISGMDLTKSVISKGDKICTSIPGLNSRLEKPLQFLGLFDCLPRPWKIINIPAKKIAGNLNCEDLLNAGLANFQRPVTLIKVLHSLYYYISDDSLESDLVVNLVLEAIERNLADRLVFINGVKILKKLIHTVKKNRNRIIHTVLNGFRLHGLSFLYIPNVISFSRALFRNVDMSLFLEDVINTCLQIKSFCILYGLVQEACYSDKQKIINQGVLELVLKTISNDRTWLHDEWGWEIIWIFISEDFDFLQRLIPAGIISNAYYYFSFTRTAHGPVLKILNLIAQNEVLVPHLIKDALVMNLSSYLNREKSPNTENKFYAACILSQLLLVPQGTWPFKLSTRKVVLKKIQVCTKIWATKKELLQFSTINLSLNSALMNLLKAHLPECQSLARLGLEYLTPSIK